MASRFDALGPYVDDPQTSKASEKVDQFEKRNSGFGEVQVVSCPSHVSSYSTGMIHKPKPLVTSTSHIQRFINPKRFSGCGLWTPQQIDSKVRRGLHLGLCRDHPRCIQNPWIPTSTKLREDNKSWVTKHFAIRTGALAIYS